MFLASFSVFPQENNSSNKDLFSSGNIKLFADYLFCQHDYLRAVNEYENYLSKTYNDTVAFKIPLALSRMGYYKKSADKFNLIKSNSGFKDLAKLEYYKSCFQDSNFGIIQNDFLSSKINSDYKFYKNYKKLYYFSYLFNSKTLPAKNDFLSSFSFEDKNKIENFYDWKENPPEKSELIAGLLSTIIPGLGKVYTKNYSDGIVAFIVTGVFSYLAYDNFRADHKFRAWLFTGIGAGFYAGNIYGSIASVQIYNAKIHFDFKNLLESFLSKKNYYTPKIDFCN